MRASRSRGGSPFKTDAKAASRLNVLDFIETHHAARPMRFLGLPSETWMFERLLLERFPAAQFVGVEHRRGSFVRAKLDMPGEGKTERRIKAAGVSVRTLASSNARLAMIGLSHFVQIGQAHPAATWRDAFCGITAAWLDLCGPVSPQACMAVFGLPDICDLAAPVPVAVTLHNAREMPNVPVAERTAEGRVEALFRMFDKRGDVSRRLVGIETYRKMLVVSVVIEAK